MIIYIYIYNTYIYIYIRMGRDLFRRFFSGEFGECVSSFLLHLPLLSAFGCLLGNMFRINLFASILFLCFSACLLFCFSAFLLVCFFAFSACLLLCFFCFSASLLLCFPLLCFSAFPLLYCSAFPVLCFSASPFFSAFPFFLLFCFLLLLCFSACLLSFLCFASSLGLSVLLWCLFYFSTFLCLMCHGKNIGHFPIKEICHESIHRDLYTHDKDCHYGMDDHTLYTMF